MASREPALLPTNDVVFFLLFAQHPDLLKPMLEAVLRVKIQSLTVLNPKLPGDLAASKTIVFDILVVLANGTRVIVELQVAAEAGLRERWVFYLAQGYVQQLAAGDDYTSLQPSVVIVWMVRPLFKDVAAFHSVFELRERSTGRLYGDTLAIHVLQLSRLRKARRPRAAPAAPDADDPARPWGDLLNARTSLDFLRLEEQDEAMARTVEQYRQIVADPEVAMLAKKREHDVILHAMSVRQGREEAERRAERRGRKKGEQRGLQKGEQRGLQKGSRLVVEKLLALKFRELPPAVHQRLEAATSDELTLWAGRILTADTLEAIFR